MSSEGLRKATAAVEPFRLRLPCPSFEGRLLPEGDGARFASVQLAEDPEAVAGMPVLEVAIPGVERAHLPTVMEIVWHDYPSRVLKVLGHEGQAYAPFLSAGRHPPFELDQEFPYDISQIHPDVQPDRRLLRDIATEMFKAVHREIALEKHLFLPDAVRHRVVPRGSRNWRSADHSLLTGDEPAGRIARSAADDFLFVGPRLYRRVHDPVWSFTARRGPGLYPLLPFVEGADALRRFRFDAKEDAARFFGVDEDGMDAYGSIRVIDPAYAPGRDDHRLSAVDAGRRMLASTETLLSGDAGGSASDSVFRGWMALDAAVAASVAGGDVGDCFDAVEEFASACRRKDGLDPDSEKTAASAVEKTRKLAAARRAQFAPAPGPRP